NLVGTDNSTVVTFAQASGAGSVTGLGGVTASAGIAQTTVTGATAGSVTVNATTTGLSPDSTTFTVAPGPAAKLVFTSDSSDVPSRDTKTLTVQIPDANDNLEGADNSTVVTFAQSNGTGSVTGLGTATASGGVAQKVVTAGSAGSVSVQASATGLTDDST